MLSLLSFVVTGRCGSYAYACFARSGVEYLARCLLLLLLLLLLQLLVTFRAVVDDSDVS